MYISLVKKWFFKNYDIGNNTNCNIHLLFPRDIEKEVKYSIAYRDKRYIDQQRDALT